MKICTYKSNFDIILCRETFYNILNNTCLIDKKNTCLQQIIQKFKSLMIVNKFEFSKSEITCCKIFIRTQVCH